ncbi:alpha/beta hydrolase [Streptomyces sp. PCS3-D2]|uniref:alpha/beta fold hydrolase n=1 Tax=Streptomyces sp. PCS3-D2 TaxID=1460244 RepID=UPI00044DABC6|nr:alpha/beta hydrolase [Streptomyces sp. PCS3-D2]WKV76022.1 alpha/beta hydrolase [Streptomyces sp. PCS3-D2]
MSAPLAASPGASGSESAFTAPDGTRLAYRTHGTGDPLVCIPGGPADSAYLGELGGLSAHRRLVVLDLRGTGRSAVPRDASSYRSDRLADDIEALRAHLGLGRIDLLAHSAGANTAMQYAARHPDRVGRLALITPGTRAVGTVITGEARRELALLRSGEPWFPAAFAALEALIAGTGGDREAVGPFLYGRWDDEARRHHAAGSPDNPEAVALFGADGAFDPEATRAGLAALRAPVLLLAGEFDLNSPPGSVEACAQLFPDATLVVQPGAGHYPWLDDAARFTAAVAAFLG